MSLYTDVRWCIAEIVKLKRRVRTNTNNSLKSLTVRFESPDEMVGLYELLPAKEGVLYDVDSIAGVVNGGTQNATKNGGGTFEWNISYLLSNNAVDGLVEDSIDGYAGGYNPEFESAAGNLGYFRNFFYHDVYNSPSWIFGASLIYINYLGSLIDLEIKTAGADYEVGDTITLTSAATKPVITVTSINGSGGVTGFTITTPGTGSALGNNLPQFSTSGIGTGFIGYVKNVAPYTGGDGTYELTIYYREVSI